MTPVSKKTAFVFAGGGSLGAVQVGMLRELLNAGVRADLVVGSSVGALNATYFAGVPNPAGVEELERIWRGLRRRDVFPITIRSALGFIVGGDSLVDPSNLRGLIERNIPFSKLESAPIPVHVVATNLGGEAICLSSGPTVETLLASAAIPVAFPSVRIGEHHLIDGAVASNTPILTAAALNATRIIVLPTGYACALREPPKGAIARALHAITLLVAHQLVRDLRELVGKIDVLTVPNPCPLDVTPYDFSRADQLLELAARHTKKWIDEGGLSRSEIPASLLAHSH